jgi:hypothetical protein
MEGRMNAEHVTDPWMGDAEHFDPTLRRAAAATEATLDAALKQRADATGATTTAVLVAFIVAQTSLLREHYGEHCAPFGTLEADLLQACGDRFLLLLMRGLVDFETHLVARHHPADAGMLRVH